MGFLPLPGNTDETYKKVSQFSIINNKYILLDRLYQGTFIVYNIKENIIEHLKLNKINIISDIIVSDNMKNKIISAIKKEIADLKKSEFPTEREEFSLNSIIRNILDNNKKTYKI